MVSHNEINRHFADLKREQEHLDFRAEKLCGRVLEHFNDYLRDRVNAGLPEGYGVHEADSILWSPSTKKYSVYTGNYFTPNGDFDGPLEIEKVVMELCEQYEKYAPWIDIRFGFELSK